MKEKGRPNGKIKWTDRRGKTGGRMDEKKDGGMDGTDAKYYLNYQGMKGRGDGWTERTPSTF